MMEARLLSDLPVTRQCWSERDSGCAEPNLGRIWYEDQYKKGYEDVRYGLERMTIVMSHTKIDIYYLGSMLKDDCKCHNNIFVY